MSCDVEYEHVSGRGTVYSYTEIHSGARHPYFVALTPYVVGLVELVEQQRLLMYTNFAGASLSQLRIGADVAVEFEEISQGAVIPQFRLTGTESKGL